MLFRSASTGNGSGGWVNVGHPLDEFAGQSLVRLRLRFASDSAVQDDGFGLDAWTVLDDPPGVRVERVLNAVPVCGGSSRHGSG